MIPLHDYLAFLSIVTLIVVSPGANLFLLLQATPVQGRVTGVLMTLGFCAAIISHATLALIGVGALVAASVTLFTIIKFVGAAYLIWLGVNENAPRVAGERLSNIAEDKPKTGLCTGLSHQYSQPQARYLLRCGLSPVPECRWNGLLAGRARVGGQPCPDRFVLLRYGRRHIA